MFLKNGENQLFSICCDTNGLIITSFCFVRDFFFSSITYKWQIFHSHHFNRTLYYLHLRKKNMTEFFQCVFFFSSTLPSIPVYSLVLFDYLFLANEFQLSVQLSQLKCSQTEKERKSKQLSEQFIVFIFTFRFRLPLSVSFFISGFVIFPPSLYDTVRSYVQVETHTVQSCDVHTHLCFRRMPLMALDVSFTWSYHRKYVKLIHSLRMIWICDFFKFSK